MRDGRPYILDLQTGILSGRLIQNILINLSKKKLMCLMMNGMSFDKTLTSPKLLWDIPRYKID